MDQVELTQLKRNQPHPFLVNRICSQVEYQGLL